MAKPHTHGPDDMPESLCRACHPELNRTPEQLATLVAAERNKMNEEREREHHHRELLKAKVRLDGLTRKGEPAEGSVSEKIAKSMRKKIKRLEHELADGATAH